jgi:RNA polymerase sigma-70 factor (ECF subfamily)
MPNNVLSDERLVAQIVAGETGLFELIMRRHNQRIFRTARAITRSDDEAEDVTQQAYLSAFANLTQFDGRAAFATWLTRIAINASLARVKQRGRRAEVALAEEDGMDPLISPLRTPEEEAQQRELRDALERAVDALPENYRLVFVLREVQQLDVAETAACLDISSENVKVRLHRAKGMLREALRVDADPVAAAAFPFLGARCDRIVSRVLARLGR